jgi:hypothetical protein
MAQSQIIDWTTENGRRMYPLQENSSRTSNLGYVLTTNLLLDLNLYIPGYPLTDMVQLLSILVSGNAVTFTFTGSNVFTVSDKTTIQFPFYTGRISNGSFLVIGQDILNVPSGTHIFTTLQVEPSLVYEISNMWEGVTQVTVAPEYISGTDVVPVYRPSLPLTPPGASSTFTGDITFYEGYNVRLNVRGQLIDLTVEQGYGIPLQCSDQFIDPTLTDCTHIISFINGVGPDSSGKFTLTQGLNVNIIDGQDTTNFIDAIDIAASNSVLANPHSIFVGLDFAMSDLCKPVPT